MNWIKISERMPIEEENNNLNLTWWMPIRNLSIFGKREGTKLCCGEISYEIEEFTHWAIVEGPKEDEP